MEPVPETQPVDHGRVLNEGTADTSAPNSLVQGDARSPTDLQAQPPAGVESSTGTILIADNDESSRYLMEQILTRAGYRSLGAVNGEDAVRILQRERVDAVLLDLSMPVMDGFRTLEVIRRLPGCATLPVIVVTAYATPEERERAVGKGCSEYLTKPFRPQELVRVMERNIRQRQ